MKPRQLPQPVLARWLDLDERVANVEQEAKSAEADVAELRRILSSGTSNVTPEQFVQAQKSFERVYADMGRKRQRANAQNRLLATVKQWIEALAPNTKLVVQHAPINGADIANVRSHLKELRAELHKLTSNPPASSDIEQRVRSYVNGLARSARPHVQGFAKGQAFTVQWPGDQYSAERGNAPLLLAALDPDGLFETVMSAIHAAQPLSAQEHADKVAQVTARITELSYTLAALVERNGGEFDIELEPRHVLGVRVAVEEEVAA